MTSDWILVRRFEEALAAGLLVEMPEGTCSWCS